MLHKHADPLFDPFSRSCQILLLLSVSRRFFPQRDLASLRYIAAESEKMDSRSCLAGFRAVPAQRTSGSQEY